MKHETARTKNVAKFLISVKNLSERSPGVEGMGLLWGRPGEGKSTVIAYAVRMNNGVFLRANSCWSVTTMLGALSNELRLPALHYRARMLTAAVEALAANPRPVFIDEADYLLRGPQMLDTLRDLYDLSGVPVVLIGMEDMAIKVQAVPKLARRITQWVEFKGVDLVDARVLCDTVCEIAVADDLLQKAHDAANGNVGRMVTALAKIESFGRTNRLETVTADAFGKTPMFYDQPNFSRGANHAR